MKIPDEIVFTENLGELLVDTEPISMQNVEKLIPTYNSFDGESTQLAFVQRAGGWCEPDRGIAEIHSGAAR